MWFRACLGKKLGHCLHSSFLVNSGREIGFVGLAVFFGRKLCLKGCIIEQLKILGGGSFLLGLLWVLLGVHAL